MLTKYCKILHFALLFAPNKFNRQDEMATAFNRLKDFALPLQKFQEKQEKQMPMEATQDRFHTPLKSSGHSQQLKYILIK